MFFRPPENETSKIYDINGRGQLVGAASVPIRVACLLTETRTLTRGEPKNAPVVALSVTTGAFGSPERSYGPRIGDFWTPMNRFESWEMKAGPPSLRFYTVLQEITIRDQNDDDPGWDDRAIGEPDTMHAPVPPMQVQHGSTALNSAHVGAGEPAGPQWDLFQ